MRSAIFSALILAGIGVAADGAEPILIADFEGATYGDWKATGTAFGEGPAKGTLPGQMHVEGFAGKGLVNTFQGGDDSTGRLTSPPITIDRKFITFLIGGGGWGDETSLNLIIDGKVVRTATGPNTEPGGTERLQPAAWDVAELKGREATIVIVDERKGGWGHINVDQIVKTDERGTIPLAVPPQPVAVDVSRAIVIERRFLHFPVKTGAKSRQVTIRADDEPVRRFDIELADAEPDWRAPLDVTAWKGKKLTVTVNALPVHSQALESLAQSDTLLDAERLYQEPLRPQIHFSARRGWLNDPNGLVFFNGEYHLFFQHNPYGWGWGNMHWGHAVSRDLVHWREQGEALYPDAMGTMFSGSAVVDSKNTSGFGQEGKPPVVLIYTAAGNPTTQCLAYSVDGRTFTKYDKNPVIQQITGGSRDPKVFWHEPTQRWVMVLYVEQPGRKHTVPFFTSPDLKTWTQVSVTEGGQGGENYLYECPDFFELPIDGDAGKKKWILTAANSEYALGDFDGTKFTPEATKISDVRGRGFYAAQTYSDSPDGRRIQIGWCQAPSPKMPFNQAMSLPCELTLRSTAEGPRLHRLPVRELASLRDGPNQADSLRDFRSDSVELRADFEPGNAAAVLFTVRGAKISYDAEKQEIHVNDLCAPAPLIDGRQRMIVYADRTLLEVFASDGRTYVPLPFIPAEENKSVAWEAKGGDVKWRTLEVYKLKSLWNNASQ